MDDMVNDWFNQLLITNERIKNERIDMVPYLAVPTPVVELIFLKCSAFGQPDEVRYLSGELFDRFTRIHLKDLLDKVWNREVMSASKKWKTVEEKLHTQIPLRMLSCTQPASKFIVHLKILRPKEIVKYLKREGKDYTLANIMASEIRVWNTLNNQLNIPTVLTFVELLLEHLMSFPHLSLPTKDVHGLALLLNDIAYLHNQEIFRKLFYLTTGRWEATSKEKREFLPIECNMLYRTTAVVALFMTFTARDLDDGVTENLSHVTNLPPEDI